MSKDLIVAAMEDMSEIIPLKREVMLEKITEWNKNKSYPYTPIYIEIGKDGIEDNSQDIKAFVDKIEAYVLDVEKNALDIEEVKAAKKTISEFNKYLSETRKLQTGPFKQTVTNYTTQENRFEGLQIKLQAKANQINAKEYAKREESIKEYLAAAIMEQDLQDHLNFDHFKDFIENKKKTNIYTSTMKLNKNFRDAADEVIRLAAEPIKAAAALKEKQQQQTAQFEAYMVNFSTEGKNSMLETNVTSLKRFKAQVPDLYPDIMESCERSIDNKIRMIEANMKTNEAMEAEEKIKNADGEHMKKAEELQNKMHDMTLSIEDLKKIKDQLSDLYVQVTFSKSQGIIKNLGVAAGKRIADLEAKEIQAKLDKGDAATRAPKTPVREEAEQTAFKYGIASADLEELDGMFIEAASEKEAIEKFTQVFREHLSMVGLFKVEG